MVGEVLGKYHPHGDTAVYNALVRLAQDFSMQAPLVRSAVSSARMSDCRGMLLSDFMAIQLFHEIAAMKRLRPCHMQISGHGNFGSIDNDPAAAMRYTECRLEALSSAMLLADLDSQIIKFAPNFDESQAGAACPPEHANFTSTDRPA